MSTTRKIQTQLATNHLASSAPAIAEQTKSTSTPIQDKSYKYIRIVINDHRQLSVIDDDDGTSSRVMNACIKLLNDEQKESASIQLHQLNHETSKLFAGVNEQYKVEIFFSKNNVTTRLPDPMCTNLVNFLKLYKPVLNPNYCCINFVYEMEYGRGSFPSDNSPVDFYYYQSPANDFSEDTLSCGDVVHLTDDISKNHHFAIYLGEHYYISIFGNIGPLLISTLEQTKQAYRSSQIAKITLFSNYDPNSSGNPQGQPRINVLDKVRLQNRQYITLG